DVSVGRIRFGNNLPVTITTAGTAKLVLNAGDPTLSAEIKGLNAASNGSFEIPLELESNLLVTTAAGGASQIAFSDTISSANGFGLTIGGAGIVLLSHSTTYTGQTTVRSGFFDLAAEDGLPALNGSELVIGDGVLDADGDAHVNVLRPNQFLD